MPSVSEAAAIAGKLTEAQREAHLPLALPDLMMNGKSIYHVSWGEEFQVKPRDPNTPRLKVSRWQRLKWWAERRIDYALCTVEEAHWRIRKAWRALRYG